MPLRIVFFLLSFLWVITAHAQVAEVDGKHLSDNETVLPSWSSGEARQRILDFVDRVTSPGPNFVEPSLRVATFDNDGTLWAEKPFYFQLLFAIDRVNEIAPTNPSWKSQEPFASVLAGDYTKVIAGGERALSQLVMATHAGMSTEEFSGDVRAWLVSSRHPQKNVPYTRLVYQPMLELLAYLRANNFKTYIVSGGGIEFIRPWSQKVYGIPPEQVVGSSIVTEYELVEGVPQLTRKAEVNFIDDKAGKPVGINQHIGRRPILAVGNSDGDFEMLEWTTAAAGPALGVLIHHTDGKREWAYDRDSSVGRLQRGLDEADQRDWLIVDMAKDWKQIFPDD